MNTSLRSNAWPASHRYESLGAKQLLAAHLLGGLKVKVGSGEIGLQQLHRLIVDGLFREVGQGGQERDVSHHLHSFFVGSLNDHAALDVVPRHLVNREVPALTVSTLSLIDCQWIPNPEHGSRDTR
jgi:hypothetical protein